MGGEAEGEQEHHTGKMEGEQTIKVMCCNPNSARERRKKKITTSGTEMELWQSGIKIQLDKTPPTPPPQKKSGSGGFFKSFFSPSLFFPNEF